MERLEPEVSGTSRIRPSLLLHQVTAERHQGRGKTSFTARLDGVTVLVQPGETVGVLGTRRDGSALISDLIGGTRDAEEGKVYVDGQPVVLDPSGAFLPEESLRFNMVRFVMAHRISGQRVRTAVNLVAKEAEVEATVLDGLVRNIEHSTVEKIRFYLSLVTGARVIVIDESDLLCELLQNEGERKKIEAFHRRGGALVVISSDIRHLTRLADRICWLHEGRIIMDDSAAAVGRWRSQLQTAQRDKDTKRAGQLLRRFQRQYEPPSLSLGGKARRRVS